MSEGRWPEVESAMRLKNGARSMDKGVVLKVLETGTGATVSTTDTVYRYKGMTQPKHKCKQPRSLQPEDVVMVENVTPNKDILVKGPCGCDFLLYDLEAPN